jgi:hypothetical protein
MTLDTSEMSSFTGCAVSDNPLYRGLLLSQVLEIPVMGIRVRFESNSEATLKLVESWFRAWIDMHETLNLLAEGVRFRIVVHDGSEHVAGRAPVAYRLPDAERFIVHTPGSVGIADLRRRDAVLYITPSLLHDALHLQYAILEPLTLVLVEACGRYPVHAAAVARGATALLLAAPGGTGKSTLAYAAFRSGLEVLSDDASYVQWEPQLRIWGHPGRLHLQPDAGIHFPELRDSVPTQLPNGKTKIVVPVKLPSREPAIKRIGVCLLVRDGGASAVERVSASEIETALAAELASELMMFGDPMRTTLRWLAKDGGWRLTLSDRPAEAVPLLGEILK